MIPRWRPVARAVALGETATAKGTPSSNVVSPAAAKKALDDALATFAEHPDTAYAAEAVAAAVLAGRPKAAQAAARSVLDASTVSPGMVRLTDACLESSSLRPDRSPTSLTERYIRTFRARLRNGYIGAHAWLDFALAHASTGEYEKATRALKVARGLMRHPTRILLRAEARLFEHVGRPDRALHVLHRERETTLADPWLLAAEIGLSRSIGSTSRHLTWARRMLKDDIAPFHLSELAAAVATEDLMAGRHRKARQLFRVAVEDPADQGLAQTVWAARHIDRRIEVPGTRTLSRFAEARAREELARFRWRRATQACEDWLAEEPFASMPALALSSVLSVYLGNYERALEVVERGLMASPNHSSLINNKAYILAGMGRLREAAEVIGRTDASSANAIYYIATAGLIALRSGLVAEGRRLYRRAFELARVQDKTADRGLAARVALYFVTEARVLGVLNKETDAAMIRMADSDSIDDDFRELRRAVKRQKRPVLSSHVVLSDDQVRDLPRRLVLSSR